MPEEQPLRMFFWNVNNKNLTSLVCSFARTTMADIVVLNENLIPSDATLEALQSEVSPEFYVPVSNSETRFHCFCRHRTLDMSEVHSGFRTSVRKLNLGSHNVLVGLVHGVDPRNYDPETRQDFAHTVATDMRFVKEQQNTNQLLMLGDFNMNPYDRGMNLATGFNAMMTRSCVESGSRRHLNETYDFYYNPMWSLFGDNTDGPAGTIWDTSNQGPYGWSMFDQVLIHHSIVDLFRRVEILTQTDTTSLLNSKGRPNSETASDHFPLLVTLCGENHE